MPDKPIIFNETMVRALLDGRKTQTRRVLKKIWHWWSIDDLPEPVSTRTRYAPGDRLWVREPHFMTDDGESEYAVYDADAPDVAEHFAEIDRLMRSHPDIDWSRHLRKRPSIHMPRWASRLTLIVTDVRVQRLQDISEADARDEGATSRPKCSGFQSADTGWSMDWSQIGKPSRYGHEGALTASSISLGCPEMAFASYWNDIHGPGAWDKNPWVAAYTFTVHKRNIDQMTDET